jgi:hypothetical protein
LKKQIFLISVLLATTASAFAIEGKWTPQQVLQLDPAMLKKEGLQLSPRQLWDPARGTGLLAATVSIGSGGGGCSGSFISGEGLVITNHHCIFGILQEHSTPQNDIITNGFLAKTRGEELPGKGIKVQVPRRFLDVTAEVHKAIPANVDDAGRTKAIEDKSKQLVAECEKQPGVRCRLAAFDGGVTYTLVEATEYSDVRLVWAPPRAIGEFGGEVDNWMWPRHTGDFSIARVYVSPDGKPAAHAANNVPHRPEFFFPISKEGVKPGDFIMVLGYPGTTYRALTAEEMDERGLLFFPTREKLYGEWINILETTTKGDAQGTIAVADNLKSLLNRYKNAQGQMAGLKRGNILEKQRAADAAVLAWAKTRPDYRDALAAREQLIAMINEQKDTYDRDFLLGAMGAGAKALTLPQTLAHLARERAKPDLEREPSYMDRNLARLRDSIEREEKNYFAPADRQLFASFVKRALALPANSRIAAIDRLFAGATTEAQIIAKIDELYAGSNVLKLADRMKMFDESEAQLRARKDPLIDLGFAIDDEVRTLKKKTDRWSGMVARYRPEWRRAVIAHAGKPVAPDANSTLRVTFGHVRGYNPRDGVTFNPQTSLSGVVEKHTGEEPFDVPEEILAAATAKKFGPWKQASINDVPVNFLGTADTTGGNSGSPTVNGKGELVGVNFDRVWENVANDFGYNPDIARNVNADARYMLWILDQVQNADALLKELGVRK